MASGTVLGALALPSITSDALQRLAALPRHPHQLPPLAMAPPTANPSDMMPHHLPTAHDTYDAIATSPSRRVTDATTVYFLKVTGERVLKKPETLTQTLTYSLDLHQQPPLPPLLHLAISSAKNNARVRPSATWTELHERVSHIRE